MIMEIVETVTQVGDGAANIIVSDTPGKKGSKRVHIQKGTIIIFIYKNEI